MSGLRRRHPGIARRPGRNFIPGMRNGSSTGSSGRSGDAESVVDRVERSIRVQKGANRGKRGATEALGSARAETVSACRRLPRRRGGN